MSMIDEVKLGSAQLLDVRAADEWQSSHAEHAIHIPVDSLLKGETGLLLPTKKIYVYYRRGRQGHRTRCIHWYNGSGIIHP
ncbi:MAG TPA: rhodanese-like domain-containing protein [Candidatus Paceibacterota bacterium]|nr:rhodanese-like domain-containing protein [Candidatus Paceibacterota bacterium]